MICRIGNDDIYLCVCVCVLLSIGLGGLFVYVDCGDVESDMEMWDGISVDL